MRATARRTLRTAALAAALLAASPAGAATPHELRWATNQDVSSLNIFLATSGNIEPLSELTMGEFTRFGPTGKPIPELVTQIPTTANGGVSADGRTVTWHLRHGVKWSDGAPFDANDVVYTFRVAMDPANRIAAREVWERLGAVEAPDPFTVVFRFKRPNALFVEDYFSTLSTTCVLPKHVLGPGTAIDEAPYNAQPIGIGPFRYTAYHRGDNVEMEANPYYWRGTPKLRKVTYKIVTDENTLFTQLETGELDLWDVVSGALAQRVRTLPGHAFDVRPVQYEEFVLFNLQRPVAGDAIVRRALELAVNRPLIVQKVALGGGVLWQSLVPTMAEGALALPLVPNDPARAAALLDAAGWRPGPGGMRSRGGVPLAIDLAIPADQPTRATTAAVLRDEWTALGVAVTIHPWSPTQYFAPAASGGVLQSGNFDAAVFANGPGPVYANVNGLYDCASLPPRGFNYARLCDRTVDALNDRYIADFDPAARVKLAQRMQRRLDADEPLIVLYERTFLAGYDARLTGYHPSAFSYWGDPLQLDLPGAPR